MHRAGRSAIGLDEGLVGIQIPHHVAVHAFDLQAGLAVNQTALGILEIVGVIKRERFHPLSVTLLRCLRGRCRLRLTQTRTDYCRQHDCSYCCMCHDTLLLMGFFNKRLILGAKRT